MQVHSMVVRLRSSRLARDGAWSVVLKTTNTLLGFLTTVLLARLLGAEGYGVYAYAYALVTLLAMPAHSGLPNLIVRETARGMAQGQPEAVAGAWRWAGRVVAVLSFPLVLVLGPVLVAWQGGIHSAKGQTLAWALPLVPLIALGNLRGAALRGLKYVVAGQLPEFVLRPGLFLMLVGGTALFVPDSLSASLAMALHVMAALVAFVIGAWMLWLHTPLAVQRARPSAETKGWLTSCALFALITGLGVINKQISTITLGAFESPGQVGVYRVAVQMATLAAFGLEAVNLVVAPRFAELYARGNTKRLQQLVTVSTRVALAFNMVLTIVFAVFGRPVLPLVFGAEFAASYVPLLIMLLGQLINSATGPVAFLLNMTGHERQTVQGMGVAAVLNIILNLILVPVWDIRGAAAATAISMIVLNVLLWWRVRLVLGVNSLAFHIEVRRST
ncbi:flippase [Thermaerobacter composti]|uniref:Flippase n=1 Tax=Thermaerobacter composti TaxID=554949 RepID=A0ABZ0QRV7_9FIRM|nr:flippase [Thermaerobacter composti]WPD20235.1 flippase [Thermaerobacter composti]